MAPSTYTRVVLVERPKGDLTPQTFRTEAVPFDLTPQAKQVLVKTIYLSLDPTMRMWLNDSRNYMEPVKIGDVMRGSGIGVVTEAGPGSRFKAGDIVDGLIGSVYTMLRQCSRSITVCCRMEGIRRAG